VEVDGEAADDVGGGTMDSGSGALGIPEQRPRQAK
jgi:hypothetical protein